MRLPGRQGKYTDVQTGKLLKRTPELVRFHAIATLHFSCIPVVLNWNYVRKEDSHASVNCPVIPSFWYLQTRQPVDYRNCHRVLDSSFSSQETLSPKSVSKSSLLKRFKLALFRRAFSFPICGHWQLPNQASPQSWTVQKRCLIATTSRGLPLQQFLHPSG